MSKRQNKKLILAAMLVIALPSIVFCATSNTDNWNGDYSLQPGVQGSVDAVVQYEDNLVLGGNIVAAGSLQVNNIVFWTGSEWIQPGDGFDAPVKDLLVFDNKLYAAGEFTGGIAAWDGSSWTALDSNINGSVYAVAVYQNELVILGDFSVEGIENCARWDGSQWDGLGLNLTEPCIDGIELNGVFWIASDDLYAFDGVGSACYPHIGTINAIEVFEEKLYVGGKNIFETTIGSIVDSRVFDGQLWHSLATPRDYTITDLYTSSLGSLYYIGHQDYPDPLGYTYNKIGKFTTTGWQPTLSPLTQIFGEFNCLGEYNEELVAGGEFDRLDSVLASNVILMGQSGQAPIGLDAENIGVSGPIYGMSVSNDKLLVAGKFSFAGGAITGGAASYDGFSWDEINTPLTHWQSSDPDFNADPPHVLQTGVHHLVEYNNTYFAGGSFKFLNPFGQNSTLSNLATIENMMWVGFAESELGSTEITGMLVHKDLLFISGAKTEQANAFDTALYSWDGSSLVDVSNGIIGKIAAIDAYDSYLYCAVQTDSTSGHIVRYDCTSWEDLGSYSGFALDIKASSGSAFVTTGDAVWFADGSAVEIGSSNGPVYAAEIYQDNLIVGGLFTEIDGIASKNLARYRNNSWESMGDVLVNTNTEQGFQSEGCGVHALRVYQGNLMVGGQFYRCGDSVTSNIARYNDHDNTAPELVIGVHANPYASQFIDIYLTGDDTSLLANVMELEVSESPIYMTPFDLSGLFWRGEHRIIGQGDTVEIHARAWDESWKRGETTLPLSTMLIHGDQGGQITSPDQQMEVNLLSGSFDGETVAMISEGTESVETNKSNVQLFRKNNSSTNTTYDVRGPALHKPATITFYISDNKKPEGWYIERADGTALESTVDTNRNTVSAQVTEFGGFLVKWSPSAGSQIADRKFLAVLAVAPNPFNPMTTIDFEIKADMHVSAVVIDLRGRTIATLLDEEISSGTHTLRWNGRTGSGVQASSGTYLVQVRTLDGGIVSRKMTLAR
jgi:hypothetical protein